LTKEEEQEKEGDEVEEKWENSWRGMCGGGRIDEEREEPGFRGIRGGGRLEGGGLIIILNIARCLPIIRR